VVVIGQAQMTFRAIIINLLTAAFFLSCSNAKPDDKKSIEQATRDIQILDTAILRFLQSWDYVQRGKASFWRKLSRDSSLYSCSLSPSIDTPKLSVYQVDNFIKYFKASLKVDSTFYKIQFIKIGNTALNLIGTNNHGQDTLLASNLSFLETFPEGNPFDTLSRLTDLKNKLNVIGIEHYINLGGFIQFYFPDGQYILTYLPDTLLNSNEFNKFWKGDFLKGQKLKPNWNLRKIDGTLNGG
jgi:hypothetical protein